jgi:enamine deaminase RidA (YjgF/YER057c/UK114 family)
MALKIKRKQPKGVNVRMHGGKPGYSHVVTVNGQLARDIDGNIVGPRDMRAQLEQTFKNLTACFEAAGATWADVVKTNTYVTDYAEFSKHREVRMRHFGVAVPTSTSRVTTRPFSEGCTTSESPRSSRMLFPHPE